MKKTLALFLALVMLLTVSMSLAEKGIDEPIEAVGIVMTMDHTFQQQLAAGWKLPVYVNDKEVNMNVYVEDPQGDIQKQIEITETYLAKGIDGWLTVKPWEP
ncbi:MAG: hypothetical protein RR821_11360 [Clostridia bacterium]